MGDFENKYGRSNRWLALMKDLADTIQDFLNDEEEEWQVENAINALTPLLREMPSPFKDLATSIIELAVHVTD